MAEYKRQVSRIQPLKTSNLALETQLRTGDSFADALGQMSGYLSKHFAEQQMLKGQQSILQEPITLEDLKAKSDGASPLDQFDQSTYYGQAAQKAAFTFLQADIENSVTTSFNDIIATAYSYKDLVTGVSIMRPVSEVNAELAAAALGAVAPLQEQGYEGFADGILSELAVTKSALLGKYNKDYIKFATEQNKTKSVIKMNRLIDNFGPTIEAGLMTDQTFNRGNIDDAIGGLQESLYSIAVENRYTR